MVSSQLEFARSACDTAYKFISIRACSRSRASTNPHDLAVVRSQTRIKIGAGASEIAESLKVRSAIQVALIERQDKSETLPTQIGLRMLHRIQGNRSNHAEKTGCLTFLAKD